MSTVKTVDFNDPLKIRQVQTAFELYLKWTNNPLANFLANGASWTAWNNQKYEWLGSQLEATSRTVNWAIVNVDATGVWTDVTFDATAGMKAGMQLLLKTSTGDDIATVCQVVSVTNGTVAKLTRLDANDGIADNAVAEFTMWEDENKTSFTAENSRQPDLYFNYFQIFDQVTELSDTIMNSALYGDPNFMANQLQQAFYLYSQKMYNAASRGFWAQRGSTVNWLVQKGTMNGYQRQINVAGGNLVNASSNPISKTLLNDLFQAIVEDWARPNTIITNYEQARTISTFNNSWTNPIVMVSPEYMKAGEVVRMFQSDLPLQGGTITNIIIDDKLWNDKVFMVDINKIALIPFANRATKIVSGKVNNLADWEMTVLRWEYTLAVKDAKYSHGIIYWLN